MTNKGFLPIWDPPNPWVAPIRENGPATWFIYENLILGYLQGHMHMPPHEDIITLHERIYGCFRDLTVFPFSLYISCPPLHSRPATPHRHTSHSEAVNQSLFWRFPSLQHYTHTLTKKSKSRTMHIYTHSCTHFHPSIRTAISQKA